MGFTYDRTTGTIDISGHKVADSRKFRNVADNGRAAFVVDDLLSVQPWRPRCVEIRGRGEAVDEPDTEAHQLTINARDVG